MTVFEMGAIGEFAGAILLFVSIFYVGVQLKQNINATKAQMYQTRATLVEQQMFMMANSPHLSDLLSKVDWDDFSNMSDSEIFQLRSYHNGLSIRMDNLYYQYENGFMDEEFYQNGFHFLIKGMLPAWKNLNILFVRPSFKNEVNRIDSLSIEGYRGTVNVEN
jgi:hypothetical protein